MKEHGMSIIVKRVTKLTVSLIFLFGVYILLHGHLTPGGGFAGGVIIALSFVHLMLAFGKEVAFRKFNQEFVSAVESFGGILFLLIALLGLSGGVFFFNFLPTGKVLDLYSAGTMIFSNIAICMKVAAGLFGIFAALAILRLPEAEEKQGAK